MKLGRCLVQNFGSYKSLDFDYSNLGLTLVYGRTGSGKSTLPDIVCWALYGVTARGGNVTDICSWNAEGAPTIVTIVLDVNGEEFVVTRIRGNAKQNDLYFEDPKEPSPVRGRDLQDTQKKLIARLGVNVDEFIASSYFHEFSETGNFFTLRAKDRRAIFERLANLELPAKLAEAAVIRRKSAKVELSEKERELDRLEGKLQQLIQTREKNLSFQENWRSKQARGISGLQMQANDLISKMSAIEGIFKDPAKLIEIEQELEGRLKAQAKDRCSECGGPKKSAEYEDINRLLKMTTQEKWQNQIKRKEYDSFKYQLSRVENEILGIKAESENPWTQLILDAENDILQASDLKDVLEQDVNDIRSQVSSLDQLYDLSSTLRGELLKRTIKQIEQETNRYLDTYFDAEIRVELNIDADKDDLSVVIRKSGYEASYTQLSKGQRSLLRLAFSVAVMQQASNKSGVHQDCLFFDEFTDGLDESMKEKVFGLLSELETKHGSVFVIDHSTNFQSMFNKKYLVTMEGDESHVESEDIG